MMDVVKRPMGVLTMYTHVNIEYNCNSCLYNHLIPRVPDH